MNHLVLNNRHVDVDASVERAALVVVAAIDVTLINLAVPRVVDEFGCAAIEVDIGLIDIAGQISVSAVCTPEDATHHDGGATRHVDH